MLNLQPPSVFAAVGLQKLLVKLIKVCHHHTVNPNVFFSTGCLNLSLTFVMAQRRGITICALAAILKHEVLAHMPLCRAFPNLEFSPERHFVEAMIDIRDPMAVVGARWHVQYPALRFGRCQETKKAAYFCGGLTASLFHGYML